VSWKSIEDHGMSRGFVVSGLIAMVIAGFVLVEVVRRPRVKELPTAPAVTANARPALPADPREADYVGSETCAKCHGAIAESYRRHPMSNSTQDHDEWRPDRSGVIGQFTLDATFVSERTPTGVVHRERFEAASGSVLAERVVPMHYVLGSGTHGCSFVSDRDGLLFMSPVSWYANGDRWDISPGNRPQSQSRFERRVIGQCLFCHAGRAIPAARETPNNYRQPVVQELAIGCERCHGPGREHVELFESDHDAKGDNPRIVNPAKLDPQRKGHVCYQCHLSGVNTIVRLDRQFRDFQPGQLLDDVWVVLVNDDTVSGQMRTKSVSQVEQMRSSRCYVGGRGELSCVSCHDPHRVPKPDEVVEHYRRRCHNCHADRGCSVPLPDREAAPQRNSCIGCHMPRLDTREIAHTALTDHRILRRPETDVAQPTAAAADPIRLFDGADRRLPEWEARRARGIGLMSLANERQSAAMLSEAGRLLETSLSVRPDDVESLLWLAMQSFTEQSLPRARQRLESLLQFQPDHEEALALLGLVCYRTGDYAAGLPAYDRLRRLDPWRSDVLVRQAEMRSAFGDLAGAVEALQKCVELNPGDFESRLTLADYLYRHGQADESRRQREIARAIQKLQAASRADR
jgi:Flp pilus assembly protein TadD